MKALTFLEWYSQDIDGEPLDYQLFMNKVDQIALFYNQKFSVDMLVNPIESHPVFDKRESNYIKYESLRLFDGWEINGELELSFLYIYNKNHTVIVDFFETSICFRENDNYELSDYCFYCGYNNITLNDFITLCNLAGIELRFNKSNETIKKLFGEDKK